MSELNRYQHTAEDDPDCLAEHYISPGTYYIGLFDGQQADIDTAGPMLRDPTHPHCHTFTMGDLETAAIPKPANISPVNFELNEAVTWHKHEFDTPRELDSIYVSRGKHILLTIELDMGRICVGGFHGVDEVTIDPQEFVE